MLRTAWWAMIVVLIMESCTDEPVAVVETAGSFVIDLPATVRQYRDVCVIPTRRGVSGKQENGLIVYGIGSNMFWRYDLGNPKPVDSIVMPSKGATPIGGMYFDPKTQVLYSKTYDRTNRMFRFTADLGLIGIDTLPELLDDSGVWYSMTSRFTAGGNFITACVGAETEVTPFLARPCLARYDRAQNSWSFLHRHPKEIRDDPQRPFWYPLMSDVEPGEVVQYFRYQFSDSIYRLLPNNSVEPIIKSLPKGVNFHEPETDSSMRSRDHYITEPRFVQYGYVAEHDLHVTVFVEGQEERLQDGRIASEESARVALVLSRDDATNVHALPDGLRLYNPFPFFLGDRVAFARYSVMDQKAGRMTFSMFRIRGR